MEDSSTIPRSCLEHEIVYGKEIGGEPQCELSGRGQGLLTRRLDGERRRPRDGTERDTRTPVGRRAAARGTVADHQSQGNGDHGGRML